MVDEVLFFGFDHRYCAKQGGWVMSRVLGLFCAVVVAGCAPAPSMDRMVSASVVDVLAEPVAALRAEIAARGQAVALVGVRGVERMDDLAAQLDPKHVVIRHRLQSVPGMIVRVDDEGLDALAASPDIDMLVADRPSHAASIHSVPLIRADLEVSQSHHDGANVTVAIVDSGISSTNADLAAALLGEGFHSLDQGASVGPGGAEDDYGHGTAVAGVVASRGIVAGQGVAPATHLYAVKVLDATGRGWASDWVAGVDHVVVHRNDVSPPIRVINVSIVTDDETSACPCDGQDRMAAAVFQAAKAAGIAIFAASGNQGHTQAMASPACISAVMAVGATDDADIGPSPPDGTSYRTYLDDSLFASCSDALTAPARFACFTSRNMCMRLLAPGVAIETDFIPGNALESFYGTSMASPHAAGVAADVLSAFPSLTVDQVYRAMLSSSHTPPVQDPASPSRTYPFLDALDTDAVAACELTCASTCSDGTVSVRACDASATCAVQSETSCGPYRCDAAGAQCLLRCGAEGDCVEGGSCTNGTCKLEEGGCAVAGGEGGEHRIGGILATLLVLIAARRRHVARQPPLAKRLRRLHT